MSINKFFWLNHVANIDGGKTVHVVFIVNICPAACCGKGVGRSKASPITTLYFSAEAVFVNLLRSPGNDSQPGRPVRQPYVSYRPAWLHRLAELIPRNRFLGSLNVYKYRLWSVDISFKDDISFILHLGISIMGRLSLNVSKYCTVVRTEKSERLE